MTTTTAITPVGQNLKLHSSTTLVPRQLDDTVTTGATVLHGNTTWGPDQPEIGTSTWRNSSARVSHIGPSRITGLDKWEGKVLEVEGEIFTAELYPIDREGMSITADFDLELLGSDAAAIVPGDVFYLSVRTVKVPGARPARTENLRLRRLGRISAEEVQTAYAKADVLMERLEQLFG
jgi:hypothetical protein